MAQREPRSAAQALYPHLPSAARAERVQRRPSLADAMFPSLSREAKWWEERRKRDQATLVRHLREAVASVRAEKGR
jgi:hypothetical protein